MIPLRFQVRTGVKPPFVIVEVKVTEDPLHIVLVDAVIEIVGTRMGFTVITSALLVAVGEVGQGLLDVITQVILLPELRPASVYVALFVPTFTPFFFHW